MNESRSKLSGILTKRWRIFPWIEFLPGETTLAWGLIFLSVSAAVFHFVMGWFLMPVAAPLAILWLVRGISRGRGSGKLPGREWAGVAFLFLGVLSLVVAAFSAGSLSWQLAVPSNFQHVTVFGFGALAWCAVSSLCSALLLTRGLSLWTEWPMSRIRIWRRVFLAFPLFTILIHQCLAALGGPLTT